MIIQESEIFELIEAIKAVSDYDFSEYAPRSFARRVEKILEDYNLTIDKLIRKVYASDQAFVQELVNDITVNTTELFRDPKVWHAIRYRILPKLKNYEVINIWHPGSSTGQEVYSMLILLYEEGLFDKVNVYASDINTKVLETARKGEYSYRLNIEYLQNFDEVIRRNPFNYEEYRDVPYTKYFEIDQINDKIKVKPFLREKPVFVKHDLVKGTNPFGRKFDIILCRNVLIYFQRSLQEKTVRFFHKNLNYPGFLVLGLHESILGSESLLYHKHGYYYAKKNV